MAYARSGTSNRTFLYADERGSIIAGANSSGSGQFINSYGPYGEPGASNQGAFQYTGQLWLAEIGFHHFKARVYNHGAGRFMQPDPIGYGDGMNMYAYVGGDPINATDPTGTDGCDLGAGDTCGKRPNRGVGPGGGIRGCNVGPCDFIDYSGASNSSSGGGGSAANKIKNKSLKPTNTAGESALRVIAGSSEGYFDGDVITVTATPTVFIYGTRFFNGRISATANSTSGWRVELDKRPHNYTVTHFICISGGSPNCTEANAFTAMRLAPAPGVLLGEPVRTGDVSSVAGVGPIITTVDIPGMSITNITIHPHKLHPGKVERSAVTIGLSVSIRSVGTGSGNFATLNEVLADNIWFYNANTIRLIMSGLL